MENSEKKIGGKALVDKRKRELKKIDVMKLKSCGDLNPHQSLDLEI